MKAITSSRLLLRPFLEADFAALRLVLGDPEVMYAWEHGFDNGEVRDWITRNLGRLAAGEPGYLAAVEKETGMLIGSIGLVREEILGGQPLCIGYILRRDRWGRGLALEGAAACIAHAFDLLEMEEIAADIRPENAASRRVAMALGMTEGGLFDKNYRGRAMPHLIYRLTRSDYNRLKKKEGSPYEKL